MPSTGTCASGRRQAVDRLAQASYRRTDARRCPGAARRRCSWRCARRPGSSRPSPGRRATALPAHPATTDTRTPSPLRWRSTVSALATISPSSDHLDLLHMGLEGARPGTAAHGGPCAPAELGRRGDLQGHGLCAGASGRCAGQVLPRQHGDAQHGQRRRQHDPQAAAPATAGPGGPRCCARHGAPAQARQVQAARLALDQLMGKLHKIAATWFLWCVPASCIEQSAAWPTPGRP